MCPLAGLKHPGLYSNRPCIPSPSSQLLACGYVNPQGPQLLFSCCYLDLHTHAQTHALWISQ